MTACKATKEEKKERDKKFEGTVKREGRREKES
jgi:hypothetical protein